MVCPVAAQLDGERAVVARIRTVFLAQLAQDRVDYDLFLGFVNTLQALDNGRDEVPVVAALLDEDSVEHALDAGSRVVEDLTGGALNLGQPVGVPI